MEMCSALETSIFTRLVIKNKSCFLNKTACIMHCFHASPSLKLYIGSLLLMKWKRYLTYGINRWGSCLFCTKTLAMLNFYYPSRVSRCCLIWLGCSCYLESFVFLLKKLRLFLRVLDHTWLCSGYQGLLLIPCQGSLLVFKRPHSVQALVCVKYSNPCTASLALYLSFKSYYFCLKFSAELFLVSFKFM